MSWIVVFASCFVSEGSIAQQASDPKEYVFFHDGAGEISTIPPNELCHQLVAATFRPDPDLFLEPLKDSQFSVLQNTPNIKVLQILCPTDPLTEQTAKIISSCKKLEVLIIENATVSPDAIRVLLKLPLKALSLRCIPVADQLQFLNTKQLKNLTLRHCGLQNKDAAAIANSHQLQYLDVHGNEYIDRRFILGLESLQKLNALHLTDVHLTTEDCHQITKSFPELRYLTAELSGVEDEAVLKSKLPDFVLLPAYDAGGSPLWGMENEVPVDAHSRDLDK